LVGERMNEARIEIPDPTHCDRCRASLERGWSERWRGERRVEAVCFDCDDAEAIAAYSATKVLTTKVMTRASVESVRREYGNGTRDPAAFVALGLAHISTLLIRNAVKDFERVVWFGGLQEQVRAAKYRGLRAGFEIAGERYKVLVWSCAGRTVFTIEPADESRQVSLICAEDSAESTMGIHGICATERQAIAMLSGACAEWANGIRFERDDKVGMI
jgi:hypothetical protein